MSTINRTSTQAHDGQIIAGIKKNLQTVSSPLLLGGQTFTEASLIAFFQSRIDAANAVSTTRAQWLDATKKYEEVNATGKLVERGLKQYVTNAFGDASPLIADFGFTPSKRAPQTVEQKAAAVAKRAATRKARNTLGKKAKLAIKGTATPAVPATPIPMPPTPAVAAPAPARGPVVGAAGEVPAVKS